MSSRSSVSTARPARCSTPGNQLKDPASNETLYHGILVDITERKNLETQLREQSIRDPLTGCYNRRQLQPFYERPTAVDEQWGCVYVDIERLEDTVNRADHVLLDVRIVTRPGKNTRRNDSEAAGASRKN